MRPLQAGDATLVRLHCGCGFDLGLVNKADDRHVAHRGLFLDDRALLRRREAGEPRRSGSRVRSLRKRMFQDPSGEIADAARQRLPA